MKSGWKIYYSGVLGGIGGLCGWQFSSGLDYSLAGSLYMSEVLVGAVIGAAIGLFIGAVELIAGSRVLRVLRSSLITAVLGLIGGAAGLPLAERVFLALGGSIQARVLGWGVFGLLLGLAAGITGGTQSWKGALGGLIGGLVGGFLLDQARQQLQDLVLGKAVGLVLLGAAAGVFLALVVTLLRRAWLEVESGKMKGSEFILDKFAKKDGPSAIIGSSSLKSEIALPDPDIEPQHAILLGEDTHFSIKDISLSGTFVRNNKVEVARLSNGAHIRMGNTELSYHEKR
jgi:hypothetical protein